MATAAITLGITGVSTIAHLFTGSHMKAVADEASALNQAVPQFQSNMAAIFDALNKLSITEDQASAAIDQSLAQYYATVSPVIKGKPSVSGSDCTAEALPVPCNGPCTVAGDWIEPWACAAKKLVVSGGTYTAPSAIPAHAGFGGAPQLNLMYAKPSALSKGVGLNIGSVLAGGPVSGGQLATVAAIGVGVLAAGYFVLRKV